MNNRTDTMVVAVFSGIIVPTAANMYSTHSFRVLQATAMLHNKLDTVNMSAASKNRTERERVKGQPEAVGGRAEEEARRAGPRTQDELWR